MKFPSDYVRWFAQSTEHLFWLVYFFLCIFDVHYAYKKHFLGSTESLGLNWSIIQQVEIIIRQEKGIFVGFKNIISWQSQEWISALKKSFFQTSSRLLLWRVEFFLRIFYECYAHEKQSLGSKESLSINESIIRQVEMIKRQERAIFVKISKMEHAYTCVEYSMRIVKICPAKPLRWSEKNFLDVQWKIRS